MFSATYGRERCSIQPGEMRCAAFPAVPQLRAGIALAAVRAADDRLDLFSLQGKINGFWQKLGKGCHRVWLCLVIILSKGDEIDIFRIQEDAYIFQVHAQRVIGGKGKHQRPVIAQMGFRSHQHGSI